MLPISASDVPAIAAASAVSLRYLVSLSPGSIPAATAVAAVVAASSRPNAVPLTLASAFFIMLSTLTVSLPRPRSFALASSMAVSRPKPAFMAPAMPATATPTPTTAVLFSPVARADPNRAPIELPSDRFCSTCMLRPLPTLADCIPALISLPACAPVERAPSMRSRRPRPPPRPAPASMPDWRSLPAA